MPVTPPRTGWKLRNCESKKPRDTAGCRCGESLKQLIANRILHWGVGQAFLRPLKETGPAKGPNTGHYGVGWPNCFLSENSLFFFMLYQFKKKTNNCLQARENTRLVPILKTQYDSICPSRRLADDWQLWPSKPACTVVNLAAVESLCQRQFWDLPVWDVAFCNLQWHHALSR